MLRPSLRPGLLKSVAYNESHRVTGVGLFEIGKVFRPPPAGQQLPDEREVLGVVLAGREAHRRGRRLGRAGRRARLRPLERSTRGRSPGCTRAGPAVVVGDDAVVGAARRDRPGRARGARHRRAGGVARGRPRRCCSALPHGRQAYEPVSRYPSSDIDLAFVVADADAGRRRPRRPSPRRPARCWSACACSTCSAARRCRPAPAAWPSPCGSRRPTAPSPTTRWPTCGPRSSTAVESGCGATLRA